MTGEGGEQWPAPSSSPDEGANVPRDDASAHKRSELDDRQASKASSLLQNRDFILLLLGQGISSLGDGVTMTAISLYVAQMTGSGAQLGLLSTLRVIPEIGFGLVAGSLADRWNRRSMMIWSDLGRALLTAAIPLAVWMAIPALSVIMVVALPLSLLTVVFFSAFRGFVASLVRTDQLGAATSAFGALITLGLIIGPALAGVLVSTVGPATTLWIDAASFLVSAALLWPVRSPRRAPIDTSSSLFGDIRAGIAYAFGDHRLRPLTLLGIFDSFVGASLIPAIVILATSRGMSSSTVGMIFSAAGIGATIGFLVSSVVSRFRPGLLAAFALTVRGALFLSIVHDISPVRLITTVGLASALNSCFLALTLSLRVSVTPDALQGRVGSTISVSSAIAVALGALIGGSLIDALNGSAMLRILGGLYLVGALAAACSRSIRDARLVEAQP